MTSKALLHFVDIGSRRDERITTGSTAQRMSASLVASRQAGGPEVDCTNAIYTEIVF